ncbi:hypothetical protein D3C78_1185970 [compost metagenome]
MAPASRYSCTNPARYSLQACRRALSMADWPWLSTSRLQSRAASQARIRPHQASSRCSSKCSQAYAGSANSNSWPRGRRARSSSFGSCCKVACAWRVLKLKGVSSAGPWQASSPSSSTCGERPPTSSAARALAAIPATT